MLLKSKISKIEIYSDEWRQFRMGKFTASNIHKIMGERGIGQGGLSYIRAKIAEELTGEAEEDEINTAAIQWGRDNEPIALDELEREMKWTFIKRQVMVWEKDSRFAATPDGIRLLQERSDGLSYLAETIEVKCYQRNHHLECVECDTAKEIKTVDTKLYWQVIMQMDECGVLDGHAVFFNPQFQKSRRKIVPFRKTELREDFILLDKRKKETLDIFYKKRDKYLQQ